MAKQATRRSGSKALNRSRPNVTFKRQEIVDVLADYEMIDDVLKGSRAVKSRGTRYLPMPSPDDLSKENQLRYDAYKTRAVFYGVAARTLDGFVGELFDKDPVLTVPAALELLTEDANGEGVGLVQLAKEASGTVLAKGRGGLFVDYPETGGTVTAQDKEQKAIRPTITFYQPQQIINWRTRKLGALTVLSLVVIEEDYDAEDDGFAYVKRKQYRILRLNDANRYEVQVIRDAVGSTQLQEWVMPTKSDGTPFDRIPFMFVGSKTNSAKVDKPPLYDLCDLNLAHYRNSAEHEENLYQTSQATTVISGLTESWADKYYAEGVKLGSHAAIPLPTGAEAKFLETQERSAIFAEMEHKERQMVALGAKLVESKSVQRTATEAGLETASEKSTLATVADNVSLAFAWALGFAAEWEGVAETNVTFRINKEFSINFSSPEARAEAIAAWQAEAISFTEMRAVLKKGGTATLPDEVARQEIMDDVAAGFGVQEDDPDADPGNVVEPGNKPGDQQQADEV